MLASIGIGKFREEEKNLTDERTKHVAVSRANTASLNGVIESDGI